MAGHPTIFSLTLLLQAQDAAARGDFEGARHYGQIAIGLNIAAVVFYVILLVVITCLAVGVHTHSS